MKLRMNDEKKKKSFPRKSREKGNKRNIDQAKNIRNSHSCEEIPEIETSTGTNKRSSKRKYNENMSEYTFSLLASKKTKLASPDQEAALEEAEKYAETKTVCEFSKLIEEFHSMSSESAKKQTIGMMPELLLKTSELKISDKMSLLPIDKLVQFLTDLMFRINAGCEALSMFSETTECLSLEGISVAVDSCLICLTVLTSSEMPKRVYIEEVIDSFIHFLELFVNNIRLSSCDLNTKKGSLNIKKFKNIKHRENQIQLENLVNPKLEQFITLIVEFISMQSLLEDPLLRLFSSVVSLSLVNMNLKSECLKIIATILLRYESFKILLFDKLLVCISRIPHARQSLQKVSPRSEEYIHPITGLLLDMIQALLSVTEESISRHNCNMMENKEAILCKRHRQAATLTGIFVSYFLNKSESKLEDSCFKHMFEMFVQDLIVAYDKIEYPASKVCLDLLGKLFMKNISNNTCSVSLKIVSIDFLSQIAVKLKTEEIFIVSTASDFSSLVTSVLTSTKDSFGSLLGSQLEFHNHDTKKFVMRYILLHFLYTRDEYESVKHFYFVEWCKDNMNLEIKLQNEKVPVKLAKQNKGKNKLPKQNQRKLAKVNSKTTLSEALDSGEKNSKSIDFGKIMTHEQAELTLRHLALNVSTNFDAYLSVLISALTSENPVLVRIRVMKALTAIVEADPSFFEKPRIQVAVNTYLHDSTMSLRENAVDLIGKYLQNQSNFQDKYYNMLAERCLDSAVNVRKKVIKILNDMTFEKKNYSKRFEIDLLLIRRIKDEEWVKKMVVDIFKSKWFTFNPKKIHDQIQLIVNTVNLATEGDLECLTKLLYLIIKDVEEDSCVAINAKLSKEMLSFCSNIIKIIMQDFLRIYKNNNGHQGAITYAKILHIFAKVVPRQMVDYIVDFSECLKEYQLYPQEPVIVLIVQIVELLLPFAQNLEPSVIQELEIYMLQLVSSLGRNGVEKCLSCLNKLVTNYQPLKEHLLINFEHLKSLKLYLTENNLEKLHDPQYRHRVRRAFFTAAQIIKFVDFEKSPVDTSELVKQIYNLMVSFLHVDDTDIKINTLKSIGNICIRHPEFMLEDNLQDAYRSSLKNPDIEVDIKIAILENIGDFIYQEDSKIFQKYRSESTKIREISLKTIDSSSTIGSLVVQHYINEILQAYLHKNSKIRTAILRLIRLILTQGIAHPIQVIPFLICMSSDTDESLSDCASSFLNDLAKKYPGFIQTRIFPGIKLSYQLLNVLKTDSIIRGMKLDKNGKYEESVMRILYSLLRSNRKQRRALICGMLKTFELQSTDMLGYQLYIADNLAYFPYNTLEEPLFVIHNIETLVSIMGSNILKEFKNFLNNHIEGIRSHEKSEKNTLEPNEERREKDLEESDTDSSSSLPLGDDESDDEETLLKSLPRNLTEIHACLKRAQGCFLLLTLKKYLKLKYGISDVRIQHYYPEIADKNLEKPVASKNLKFNPKMVIEELSTTTEISDEDLRKKIISKYVSLKTLILEFENN